MEGPKVGTAHIHISTSNWDTGNRLTFIKLDILMVVKAKAASEQKGKINETARMF
jgi:hypothetical protein